MRGSTSTVESQLSSLADVCTKAETSEELFEQISNRLRRLVPFDGAGWFATDPATVLATSPVRVENIETSRCESYWEREFLVEDVLLFRDLVRSESGVATLYTATDDQPARSARYREFIAPQGYGDELRAAFRLGGSTWGVVDLYRDRARGSFTPAEVGLVRALLPVIATTLRTFTTAAPRRPGSPRTSTSASASASASARPAVRAPRCSTLQGRCSRSARTPNGCSPSSPAPPGRRPRCR
ncbi:transcriptional regulator, LuxR family [Parafrankia sp. EAN1pec]|uniref:hypothetical protein n=1 Tax=Parafrankia sp. (strain EAN1pec) TaxID=298653 RepID=UPI0000543BFD|nr:transcriptional regulator, LuxR family [Frankia sp. EAN1pec]